MGPIQAFQKQLANRAMAEEVRKDFHLASSIARSVLDSGHLSAAEIEARFDPTRPNMLRDFTAGLMGELLTGLDQQVLKMGLPDLALSGEPCAIQISEDRIEFQLGWCEQAEARSLRHCSAATRAGVLKALRALKLPICLGHELFEDAYAVGDALPKSLPDEEELSDAFLQGAWEHALAHADGEGLDDAEEGEPVIYGIGGREDFDQIVKLYHAARRELSTSAPFDRAIDQRWKRKTKVLTALKGSDAVRFWDGYESTENRSPHEAWVICAGDAALDLIEHYYNQINDGSGEIPGGSLLLEHAGGLPSALLRLKVVRGVLNLFHD